MAEDRSTSPIIGFWPPAGSIFMAGANSGSDWNAAAVFVPLTNRYILWEEYESAQGEMCVALNLVGNENSTLDNMDATPIKTDFAWFSTKNGRPLFLTVGGDIQQMFTLTNGTAGNSRIWDAYLSNAPATVVTEIGGRYYVSSGDHSKILFDCGTSAPPSI